jgi:bla regulator protein BlaR1
MANDVMELLIRLTLAASAAIVLVLLTRRSVRRLSGADAAYHSWLVVLAAMAAAALPALREAPMAALALAPSISASTLVAQAAPAGTAWLELALLAWAAGALATAGVLLAGQRRYVRSLGVLTRCGDKMVAANPHNGPALLGLWRPVVVVPSDFTVRYSQAEQALIIAHEKLHAERRDPAINALLALLQCAFWFNPLIHIAASRARFDQELACDAAVLARACGQRQAYAAAMLKTQGGGAAALATCHWQSSHPLKERIMQLKQSPISTPRRHAGRAIVAMLACASVLATVAARADTAPAGGDYEIAVQFAEGTDSAAPPMPVKAGEPLKLNWKQKGHGWSGDFTVTPAKENMVLVKLNITQENGAKLTPTVMARLGENAAVKSSKPGEPTFSVSFKVTRPGA